MTADGKTQSAPFEVTLDPRVKTSLADLQKQNELILGIRAEIERVFAIERQIHDVRNQISALQQRLPKSPALVPVADAGANLDKKLVAIEENLVNWKIIANEDSLQYPVKLDGQLSCWLITSEVGLRSDGSCCEEIPTAQERSRCSGCGMEQRCEYRPGRVPERSSRTQCTGDRSSAVRRVETSSRTIRVETSSRRNKSRAG